MMSGTKRMNNQKRKMINDDYLSRNTHSSSNNRNFIRLTILGRGEEIICFNDIYEMTIKHVLYSVRYLARIYNDELYIVDEHGKELTNYLENVQHGRSYICKRRL